MMLLLFHVTFQHLGLINFIVLSKTLLKITDVFVSYIDSPSDLYISLSVSQIMYSKQSDIQTYAQTDTHIYIHN